MPHRPRLMTATMLLAMSATTVFGAEEPATPAAQLKPLAVEDLGVPVRTMRRAGDMLIPKADGKGWWFITCYNPMRQNTLPCQVYVVDLETRKVAVKELHPSGFLCAGWSIQPLQGLNGKWYIAHTVTEPGREVGLWEFDPADGALTWHGCKEIVNRLGALVMTRAADGVFYVGLCSNQAMLFAFDPRSNECRSLGEVGPHHHYPRYVWSLAAGDDYVYAAAGKNPWYLVAIDRKSGKQTIILQGDIDYMELRGGGDHGTASVTWQAKDGQPKQGKHYRLEGLKAVDYDPAKVPAATPAATKAPATLPPKPELILTRASPNSEGKAQVWWRLPGGEWQSIELTGIQTQPWRFEPLALMPDGRILGAPRAYEDFFAYDPKANAFQILGKAPISTGAMTADGDKVYILGYPGTYILEYDPKRPWTTNTTTPTLKEPAITSPESNPRECHRYSIDIMPTHHIRGAAVGADGDVYFGSHAERNAVGGGLGWWDPKLRKAGGLREPFLAQDCAGLTAAREGRLIIYSSFPVADPTGKIPTPREAKLYVLDVKRKEIAWTLTPVAGMISCGAVAAVADRLVGIGRAGKEDVLYVVDLAARKTLHTAAVAAGAFDLQAGPDGRVYGFVGNVLVRMDPRTFALEQLGGIDKAGRILFVDRDLYLTGRPELRRIRNVTALP